jgi:hypothetical protein
MTQISGIRDLLSSNVDTSIFALPVSAIFFIFPPDSSVGIVLGYGLDGWGSRVRFPVETGNFSLHHRVQNGSGAHPASYSMDTRAFSPGVKAAGA